MSISCNAAAKGAVARPGAPAAAATEETRRSIIFVEQSITTHELS
jgi:hypothetical protein